MRSFYLQFRIYAIQKLPFFWNLSSNLQSSLFFLYANSLYTSQLLESLSLAYNEVHLYYSFFKLTVLLCSTFFCLNRKKWLTFSSRRRNRRWSSWIKQWRGEDWNERLCWRRWNNSRIRQGGHFTNILLAAFLFKSCFFETFLSLQFDFVLFWQKEISTKMLVNLWLN